MIVAFEAAEPDDATPIHLPIDDFGRRAARRALRESIEEGTERVTREAIEETTEKTSRELVEETSERITQEAVEETTEQGTKRCVQEAAEELPEQIHHFATNKSKKWTAQLEDIVDRYSLKLDGDWNKASLPHQGRHPDAYHEWVLDQMKQIDNIAQGDQDKFIELFNRRVKEVVEDNPEMLRKTYWE
jgi:histone H3/H4